MRNQLHAEYRGTIRSRNDRTLADGDRECRQHACQHMLDHRSVAERIELCRQSDIRVWTIELDGEHLHAAVLLADDICSIADRWYYRDAIGWRYESYMDIPDTAFAMRRN